MSDDKLRSIEVDVAKNYVSRNEHREAFQQVLEESRERFREIFASLQRIEDKLDGKADR
jgi:hypothetical protein